MLSPLETGTARGQLRDVGGVGKPEPRAGSRPWRAARGTGKARQLADLVRRGQARSPASHTWRGPCLILPDTSALARTDTPASILTPAASIPGLPSARTVPRPTRLTCPRTPARSQVSVSRPRRSKRPETSRDDGGSDGPGFLAVAHVPEHPLITARGPEVAVHPVTLGCPETGT